MMRKTLITLSMALITHMGFSQNVGIGTSDPKAKLDISSTTSGLLIPRLTMQQRDAIPTNPPIENGMLIYQTDNSPGFYFYNGSSWVRTAVTSDITGTNSGTNTGDQTITLTGDVTGSGTGSFPTTIANDAVTNSKLADMATQTIKGRTTAGIGDPEDLTPAQVRTMLNVDDGANNYVHPTQVAIDANATNNGQSVIDRVQVNTEGHVTSVLTRNLSVATTTAPGIMSAADKAKLDGIASGATANTGTVTSITAGTGLSGGTITTTGTISIANGGVGTTQIADGSVANVDLANMPANTIKGNNTGSDGAPIDVAVPTNTVLGRKGGNIVAEQVATAQIEDNAITTAKITNANVTYAKIQNVGASRLLGNPTGTAAAPSEISLGAGLNFSGSELRTNTYPLPNTGGTAQWVRLGTLTIPQQGHSAFIRVVTNTGYNASTAQNSEILIRFKTSNAASFDPNGFSGDGTYYVTGRNTQFANTGNIKWRGNAAGASATAYDLFMNFGAYTGDGSFYEVSTSTGTWTHAGAAGQSDPGAASATVMIPANELALPNLGGSGNRTVYADNNGVLVTSNVPPGSVIVPSTCPVTSTATITDDFETNNGWTFSTGTGGAAVIGGAQTNCGSGTCITGGARGGSGMLTLRGCNSLSGWAAIATRNITVGSGGGSMSFWYKVGSEDCNCDGLYILVNDVIVGGMYRGCQNTWTQVTGISLLPGVNKIQFGYWTDGAWIERGSRAQVDDISITSNTVTCNNSIERIVRGNVNSDATVSSGGGFVCTRPSTGIYVITFNNAFSSAPTVVATQVGSGNTRDNALVYDITSTSFRVKVGDSGGTESNRPFTFIAIGSQ